jgi:phosphoribosylanthranilate isomerase
MWVKVCGMTSNDAIEAALGCGADAIGFVFAESKRQITPQRAALLAMAARGRIQCVAVTRHPDQAAIDEILSVFKPDALQTDAEDIPGLTLPSGLPLLPVLRLASVEPNPLPARFLYEGPSSGSGVPGDWPAAELLARRGELVLAGGLTPDNVTAAITLVRPYGVDVSTGVESRPGIKSTEKIASFVRRARAAFRSLEEAARGKEKPS